MKQGIFFFLLSMILLVSCEKLDIPSEETNKSVGEVKSVKIVTRSTTNDVAYPLYVYAFDSKGSCSAQQTINSESEDLSFSLAKGQYKIVALTASKDFAISTNPTLSSLIELKNESNYSSSPLQLGQADITVDNTSQTVNLTLSYKCLLLTFLFVIFLLLSFG